VKTKIRIDRESGLAYIAKALREEGFVGEVVGLADARNPNTDYARNKAG